MEKNRINYDFYNIDYDFYLNDVIDNKIMDYIKSGRNVDKILEEDNSWPVFYHVSESRKNIFRWYPFKKNCSILEIGSGFGSLTSILCEKAKKVVSIEASKKRAEATITKNKNFKNLSVIAGNFLDVEFKEKFDYITLIGSLKYAPKFSNGSLNAYEEMLAKAKKLLKPNGKIIIGTDNRFGIKYWCGAKDDYTNKVFGTINYDPKDNTIVKLFSKYELENIFNNLDMHANFYYPLPDYKFAETILTDNILKENLSYTYTPYYSSYNEMFACEKGLFNEIIKNNEVPFFANSYFVELSIKKGEPTIEFAKLNFTRYNEYATITYKIDDRYYKKAIYDEGTKHIDNICNYYNILMKNKVNCVPVSKDKNECYTKKVDLKETLMDELIKLYKEKNYSEIYAEIDRFIDYLKRNFNESNTFDNTIFDKYNLVIDENIKNKFTYVEHGFIDLCFQNIFIQNEKYLLIDQEWYEKNVPIEFMLYRAIHLFIFNYLEVPNKMEVYMDILNNISIDIKEYLDIFDELEERFIKSVINNDVEREIFNKYSYYFNSDDFSEKITDAIYEHGKLEKEVNKQDEVIKHQADELNKAKTLTKEKNQLIRKQSKEIDKLISFVNEKDDIIEKQTKHCENMENKYKDLEIRYNKIINTKMWKIRTKAVKLLKRK